MCKIIVCSGRNLILGGKNVHPSFAYSSCSTHIVLYHIYDIDYVYRIYYMMHAAVYLVVERSQPPMPPMPTILGPPPLHPPRPSVGQAGSLSQSLVGPASWAAQVLSFPHSPPLLFEQPVDIEHVSFVRKTVHPQNLRLLILTMKFTDSTPWYYDVWYQLLCDVEYCERISNIRLCVILKHF